MKKNIALIVVLLAIAGAIGYLEHKKPKRISTEDISKSDIPLSVSENAFVDNGESPDVQIKSAVSKDELAKILEDKTKKYPRAKEITEPSGFLNTEGGKPVSIKDLIGKKVILIDFLTYSCINCQRTFPYVNSWDENYKDKGLQVIGIHTPEFDFEKDPANVAKALIKFGIQSPIVLDNNYGTWTAYGNQYWPRKYLIDIDGFIVYDHIGEGSYDETEAKIVELLNERNKRLGLDVDVSMEGEMPKDTTDFTQIKSPETYLGQERIGAIANLPKEECLKIECTYVKPETLGFNKFALAGKWKLFGDQAVLTGETGSILYHFSAAKVYLVMHGTKGPVSAEIYLDGKNVDANSAGSDVKNGQVMVDTADLYNLIDLKGKYGEHTLEIRFLKGNVSAFAFTFG